MMTLPLPFRFILLGIVLYPAMIVQADIPVEDLRHGEHALMITRDLSRYAEVSRQQQLPVLLMFGTPGCDYCARLEAEVLHPMTRNGEHPGRVLIAKVMVSEGAMVKNFDGALISATDLSARHRVKVFPTVVIVDPHGHALVESLVGYGSPDFYGAYLDNAISAGQHQLAKRENQRD